MFYYVREFSKRYVYIQYSFITLNYISINEIAFFVQKKNTKFSGGNLFFSLRLTEMSQSCYCILYLWNIYVCLLNKNEGETNTPSIENVCIMHALYVTFTT